MKLADTSGSKDNDNSLRIEDDVSISALVAAGRATSSSNDVVSE